MTRTLLHIPKDSYGLDSGMLTELMRKIESIQKETFQECQEKLNMDQFCPILNARLGELAEATSPASVRIADHALQLHNKGDEVYLFKGNNPLTNALNKFNKIFVADESILNVYKNERNKRNAPIRDNSPIGLSAAQLNQISILVPNINYPHLSAMITQKEYTCLSDDPADPLEEDYWNVFLSKDIVEKSTTPVSMLDPDLTGCEKLELMQPMIRDTNNADTIAKSDAIEQLCEISVISFSPKGIREKTKSTVKEEALQKIQGKGFQRY